MAPLMLVYVFLLSYFILATLMPSSGGVVSNGFDSWEAAAAFTKHLDLPRRTQQISRSSSSESSWSSTRGCRWNVLNSRALFNFYTLRGGGIDNSDNHHHEGQSLSSSSNQTHAARNDDNISLPCNTTDDLGKEEFSSVHTIAGDGSSAKEGGIQAGGGKALEVSLMHPFSLAVGPNQDVFFVEPELHQIRKVTPEGNVVHVAGTGNPGYQDGVGSVSMFDSPHGITVDRLGSIYVADTGNHRIRVIQYMTKKQRMQHQEGGGAGGGGDGRGSDDGEYLMYDSEDSGDGNNSDQELKPVVQTFAGWRAPGYLDGLALGTEFQWDSTARMTYPYGVCIDKTGNLYIADTFNNCFRRVALGAMVKEGKDIDFNGFYPMVAESKDGRPLTNESRYLVLEEMNIGVIPLPMVKSSVIFLRFKKEGTNKTVIKFEKYWMVSERGLPHYVAAAREDDQDPPYTGYRCILSPPPAPKVEVGCFMHTLAGRGSLADSDGVASKAEFMWPQTVATDNGTGIYTTIYEIHHKIKHILRNGTTTTLAGSEVFGKADGFGFVADTHNGMIRKVTPAGNVSTVAGRRTIEEEEAETDDTADIEEAADVGRGGAIKNWRHRDGPLHSARFFRPYGIALDQFGSIYVADTLNNRIRMIRRRVPYAPQPPKMKSYSQELDFVTLSNSTEGTEGSVLCTSSEGGGRECMDEQEEGEDYDEDASKILLNCDDEEDDDRTSIKHSTATHRRGKSKAKRSTSNPTLPRRRRGQFGHSKKRVKGARDDREEEPVGSADEASINEGVKERIDNDDVDEEGDEDENVSSAPDDPVVSSHLQRLKDRLNALRGNDDRNVELSQRRAFDNKPPGGERPMGEITRDDYV
eukprot:jgi/Bigna1/67780/fgenesh1_pg.4_\